MVSESDGRLNRTSDGHGDGDPISLVSPVRIRCAGNRGSALITSGFVIGDPTVDHECMVCDCDLTGASDSKSISKSSSPTHNSAPCCSVQS